MRNIKSTYKWEGIRPTGYAVLCHIEVELLLIPIVALLTYFRRLMSCDVYSLRNAMTSSREPNFVK